MARHLTLFLLFPLLMACSGGSTTNPPVGFEINFTGPASDGFLAVDGVVTASFTKSLDTNTINESTFTVSGATGTVSHEVGSSTATFTPSAPLTDGTFYTATISSTVADVDGETLGADYTWSFTAKVVPSAPIALTATGTLNEISLSWTAPPGTIESYRVYRSEDGTDYEAINSAIIESGTTTYEDTIESPEGDGQVYFYRVRASNGIYSPYSNVVRQIHGTRMAAIYSADPSESLESGVYVIEGNTQVNGADFTVPSEYSVHVFDDSTLTMEEGFTLVVEGLFSIVADEDHPATLSGHNGAGGDPVAPAGFLIDIDGSAIDYDETTGMGTLLAYSTIEDLQCTGEAIQIGATGPRFFNNKIEFNCPASPGAGYVEIQAGSSASFSHNDILGGTFLVSGEPASTFLAELNDVQNGSEELKFSSYAGPGIVSGQFTNNRFDGGTNQVELENVTGTGTLSLINNFWPTATPTVNNVGSGGISVEFDPELSSAPSDVGATW